MVPRGRKAYPEHQLRGTVSIIPSFLPRLCSILFLVGVLVLGVVTEATAQQAPLPAVVVAPAEMSDLRDTVTFPGRLVASQKIDLRARVSGFLQEIYFREGEYVEEGAPLYKIDDGPYAATIAQIEGSIAATDAELRLARIEEGRKETLVARETVSQSELDVAQANVGKVEGEIARLQGQLDRAKLDVDYTEISAPFAGVVGLTAFDVGAFVGQESGALTTLTRLDPITVEFPIPSAVYLTYRQNNGGGDDAQMISAEISLLLPNGSTYSELGTLDFIDAQVSRGTDTVIARAVFDNPNRVLLDGGLVVVEIVSADPQLVLNVPQQAVQRDQVGDFVMVVDASDTVEQRRVRVSTNIKGRAVIADGLEDGELVITEGINKVRPGITVDAAISTDG